MLPCILGIKMNYFNNFLICYLFITKNNTEYNFMLTPYVYQPHIYLVSYERQLKRLFIITLPRKYSLLHGICWHVQIIP